MLPSPRWPKPLAITPGKARFDLAAASTMKARHIGDRHRDVVGQRLAFGALGLRDGVAELPEGFGLRFVGGKHRVGDQPCSSAAPSRRSSSAAMSPARRPSSLRSARASDACPSEARVCPGCA